MSVYNAPQFVDFTSGEAFDIHDGADYCFEKIVVGEGIELGSMSDKNEENDKMDDLIAILKNATNLNKNNNQSEMHPKGNGGNLKQQQQQQQHNPNDVLTNKNQQQHKSKENQQPVEAEKKADIVGTTIPGVGSALDLINSASQHNVHKPITVPKAKTPCKIAPSGSATPAAVAAPAQTSAASQNDNHKRTLSTTTKGTSDRPLLPMYKGVKFIPKLAHKQHSQDVQTPSKEIKNTMTTSSTVDQLDELIKNHRPACLDASSSNNNNNNHKPTIMSNGGHKEAPAKLGSSLTRSTPGKSASFKQQLNEKKANIISTFASNLLAKPKPAQKLNLPAAVAIDSNADTSEFKIKHGSMSSSLSNSKLPMCATSSMMVRKKSESKQQQIIPGLLHTEMRALKRHEYEQAQKEKERLAQQVKHDIEQEKLKKQQEEIQKIRSKSNFRSNPIKHYKPIELKPSEKPLTEPRSPQFNLTQSTSQSHRLMLGNSSMQNSASNLANVSNSAAAAANTAQDPPRLAGNKIGYSHDDERVNY